MSLALAEKLRIAGYSAPRIRDDASRRTRSIKVVDGSGKVLRELSAHEVVAGVLRRADIEFDVVDDRPQTRCAGIREGGTVCKALPGPHAFTNQRVMARGGKPWRCRKCVNAKTLPVVCSADGCEVVVPSARAYAARTRGSKTYCDTHRSLGTHAQKVRTPCQTCGAPSTKSSHEKHRTRGSAPYCEKHQLRRPVKRVPLPCVKCGAPSTPQSNTNALGGRSRPYCEAHTMRKPTAAARDQRRAQVASMLANGLLPSEIAIAIGYSLPTALRDARELGWKPSDSSGRRAEILRANSEKRGTEDRSEAVRRGWRTRRGA